MSTLPDLPVLSIRQPWAWLILHARKDIENRVWYTRQRGRFLIHAAKGCTRAEYEAACEFSRLAGFRGEIPDLKQIERGGIVGSVELVDCVSGPQVRSPWYCGEYGFVLRDPQPLPFHPCAGQLGFFRLS